MVSKKCFDIKELKIFLLAVLLISEPAYHFLMMASTLYLATRGDKVAHLDVESWWFTFKGEEFIGFIDQKDVIIDLFLRGPMSDLFRFSHAGAHK